MKERIVERVGELLPDLVGDIKTICNMDSRQDTATPEHPFGVRVTDCLNKALEIARGLGFETENVGNQIGIASWGPDTEEYIACVGHLDVVDVNGVWKTDPFVCTEKDGFLYARGVLDNKGPMFCCLYGLKALVDLGYGFPIKVKIIFGTNEETGMEDMKWYFQNHKYPLMGWTPDCKYPVIYAERGRAAFRYSLPKAELGELVQFLNGFVLNQNDLSSALGVDYADEEFGKNQVRKVELFEEGDTCGLTLVSSYPASYSLDTMREALEKLCTPHMTLSLDSNLDPVFFDKDTYLVKTLEHVYEEIMQEDGSAVTTTGGSYAKVVKNIVPFGPSFKGQKGIGHMPDEWMRICDIEKNAQIYGYAFYRLMDGLGN
ncbi:MAG: M20 family metallopeptidase [Lachnospiraceae bacterium]|nr:M20 family metallopeptidase [Lachnospiraceae bacterium]